MNPGAPGSANGARAQASRHRWHWLLPGCVRLEAQYAPRPIPHPGGGFGTDCNATQMPLISIVVPSYNQGRFLGATLQSVLSQGYPRLELIVVDGGSSDESAQLIAQYAAHIHWSVSEPDNGQAHAINKGMQQASGEILAWLNSDDCLMPGALWRVAEAFRQRPDTDVVYGHRVLIDEQGMDVGRWILPVHAEFLLTYADYIPQETLFWRAGLWRKCGARVDESFRFALDWELIRRFIDSGARFRLLPFFLGQFRLHEAQKSQANIELEGFREMEVIRRRCRESFSRSSAMQKLYYRVQRASFLLFALRARISELLWQRGRQRIY